MSDKIDISPEAVEQLARDLPNSQWQAPNLHLARETLRALRARLAEVEKELVEMTAAKEIHQTRRAEYFDRAERAEAAPATARWDAITDVINLICAIDWPPRDGDALCDAIRALANEVETSARGMP